MSIKLAALVSLIQLILAGCASLPRVPVLAKDQCSGPSLVPEDLSLRKAAITTVEREFSKQPTKRFLITRSTQVPAELLRLGLDSLVRKGSIDGSSATELLRSNALSHCWSAASTRDEAPAISTNSSDFWGWFRAAYPSYDGLITIGVPLHREGRALVTVPVVLSCGENCGRMWLVNLRNRSRDWTVESVHELYRF